MSATTTPDDGTVLALGSGSTLATTSGTALAVRNTTIGGLNSFYRLGGRNYDVGLHAVTGVRVVRAGNLGNDRRAHPLHPWPPGK